jgi:MauM/NapG family ferredoxin protein
MVVARRTAQIAFLLAFLALVVAARTTADQDAGPGLKLFFWLDPLVLLCTWLSAHAVSVGILAVLAALVGTVVAAVLRRWISAPLALLLAVAGVGGAIVVASLTLDVADADTLQRWHWVPLPASLMVALATVALTLVLGRVFCGWICPLGTVHAIASRLFRRMSVPLVRARNKDNRDACPTGPWSPWQKTKYFLVAGMLAMALVGGHWVTIFDPLVLLYRTTTTAILPAFQWAVEEGSTAVVQAEPTPDLGIQPEGQPATGASSSFRLSKATEPVYETLRDNVFKLPKQAFLGSGAIVGFFLVTLALNAWRPRFWCRYVCPLGGLLGVLSLRPLLRRNARLEGCNHCGLCDRNCHGAATQSAGEGWIAAECLACFHCDAACPRDALSFQWALPGKKEPAVQTVDLSRRATLASAIGGVAALAALRSTPQARGKTFHARLVRPPGSREEREFLARCTACGMCMKICPSGGLQPCWSEAGLEGLWTPHLVPQIGPCHQNCPTLCGQVCPTGAIRVLTLEQKQETKIGLASFDVTRCIPYAYGRDCGVCEEVCPVPTKAIYTVNVEVQDHDGNKSEIKQPRIDPSRCTGCGECVYNCPLRDSPGIRVFSANETRNPDNQPILAEASPYGGG